MTGQRKRAEVEMEGGGTTWWYVCGECHGAVNYRADICRHCKALLLWEGLSVSEQSNFTGEQSEPAE